MTAMSNPSDAQNRPSACPLCGCRDGEPAPPDLELLRRWLGEPIARRIGLHRLPPGLRLSVVMPVYNEKDTVAEIVRRVRAVPDPQADHPRRRRQHRRHPRDPRLAWKPATTCEVHYHERNQGKGAALRTGFAKAAGDIVIVQDADLEYDADQYPAPDPADRRGPGRRGLRLAFCLRRPAPRALLLALRGQPRADHVVEHVHRPEPDRHGDLLQGLPPRGGRGDPADA